jgi:NTE family protein
MDDSSRYMDLLASMPCFAGLDAVQLRTLYGFCALKVLAKGESATVAGATVEELGIIVSGRVVELEERPAARELGRGSAIEANAFFTRRPAAAAYAALRETVLLTLAWDDLVAAIQASPDLLSSCFSRMSMDDAALAFAASRPTRLAICPAGAHARLDPAAKAALLSALEDLAEIRLLGRGSFGGGMPGAITLDAPETAHWLQQQELEFDLTVFVAEGPDLDFAKETIEEADEILFIAAGNDPSLSALEQHTLETRGGERCRLAIVRGERLSVEKAAEWTAQRPYRSTQAVDFASPEAVRLMGAGLLGKGNAMAATSRGVYAAAILGALQAFEAHGLPAVSLVAAGSAILPAGLLASGASLSDIEAIFRELANPVLWKRAVRAEAGLFEPAPIDNFLTSALSGRDIAISGRPFAAVSRSLSNGGAEVHRQGPLHRVVRAGVTSPGLLPPVILEDGTILVSGENETEAVFGAAKAIAASPLFFLHPSVPPLGLTSPYRTAAALLRLTPFQSLMALDKRVRIETVLGACSRNSPALPFSSPGWDEGVAQIFAVPIPEGVSPMDWPEWSNLRDRAFEWASTELETRSLGKE